MPTITRDPLLAIAKTILWVLIICMGIAVIGCLIGAPAMFLFADSIRIEVVSKAPDVDFALLRWAIVGLLLAAAGVCAVLMRVFVLLKQIVETVGQGDPFVPENARRLTQMAWLTLAMQALVIPVSTLASWIDGVGESAGADVDINVGISGNGLLLTLVLFILARVFRIGAEMRAELEGTV